MQTFSVKICGINTSELKVLPEKEKIKLLKLAKKGVKGAREKLIEGNLRLVLRIIQKFYSRGESPDDLFQIGCIGLIRSIDNFDISQNVKFSTYAVPMIIGEIRRYLRDNSYIKISRSMRDIANRVINIKEHITNQKNAEPSVNEIAQELNIPREDVILALEAVAFPISMNEPIFSENSENKIYVMDQIKCNENEDSWLEEISIKQSIKKLSTHEKNILFLRFIKGKTQKEVANICKTSQAQISRIEKSALKKIRN